jgi:hypothetical protein
MMDIIALYLLLYAVVITAATLNSYEEIIARYDSVHYEVKQYKASFIEYTRQNCVEMERRLQILSVERMGFIGWLLFWPTLTYCRIRYHFDIAFMKKEIKAMHKFLDEA